MTNQKYFYLILIILLVFFSRYFFSLENESYYSPDPVIYEAAVKEYSLANRIPHLPGYYLYVKSINFLVLLGFTPSYAQVFFSILFSILSSIIFFLTFNRYLDYKKSFLLILYIFSNPAIYFYGLVNENYIFDLFAGGLIYYISFYKNRLYMLFPILAVIAGFRQTTGLLLAPFVLYIFWENRYQFKQQLLLYISAIILSLIIFLSWFIPMTSSIGGGLKYLTLFIYESPIPKSTFIKNFSAMVSISFYFFLPIFLFVNWKKCFKNKDKILKSINLNILIWFFIPILFFMIFHYNKGYILLPLGAIFILMSKNYNHIKFNNLFIYTLILIQLIFFFIIPYTQPHYQIYLKSNKREISKIETWQNRMLTKWIPVNSHINYLNHYHNSVNEFCYKLNQLSTIDSVIVLPTIDTDAFTFSIRMPNKTIIRVGKDYIIGMNDCIVDNNYSKLENIEDKYYISNNNFINKKIVKYSNIIFQNDELTLFQLKDSEKLEVLMKWFK